MALGHTPPARRPVLLLHALLARAGHRAGAGAPGRPGQLPRVVLLRQGHRCPRPCPAARAAGLADDRRGRPAADKYGPGLSDPVLAPPAADTCRRGTHLPRGGWRLASVQSHLRPLPALLATLARRG